MRLRSDMRLYESDGTAWTDFVSGGAPPSGSISSTSAIIGNPPALDTPAEMAAAIQALQGFQINLDTDGDGRVNAEKQQDKPFSFPLPQPSWTINHNLGRRPAFELFDAANNGIDEPPRQDPTLNTTIFTWLIPQAGTATAI